MRSERFKQSVDQAEEAFWEEVGRQFPDILTGDFPPDASFAFSEACLNAVGIWLFANSPESEGA